MPVSDGVPDEQIDAPQEPLSVQQRTAAVLSTSSVQSIVAGAFAGHASTVSANG